MKPEAKLMSTTETAALLGVGKQTLRRLKDIPRYRIGGLVKYKRDEVEEWIESNAVGSES